VAPLEFAFLADSWLIDHGLRNKTEVVYITPRTRVFAEPTTERVLGHLIEKKRIKVVTDFHIRWLDNDRHKIISRDGKDIDYDLLVTVPTNTGDVAMGRSGLGNELNFVATNRHTLQSKQQPNIFVLGDATDLPSSKSGSVAYIQSEVLTENILRYIKGEPLELRLDRHADHFVDSERDKELQLASNYSLQTVEGRYPSPVLGPFSTETDLNQFRQLVFRWIYETCSPEVWRYRELAMR